MAAGTGTRLMPLTKTRPKAMVDIAGKPLLEHTFEQIAKLTPQVTQIILVTGYQETAIKEYFKEQFQGIPIQYVTQHERLGTGHAVLVTEEHMTKNTTNTTNSTKGIGQFLVINGDDLYHYKDLHALTKYPNCILLKEVEDVSAFGVVTIDNEGKVTGFVEKPRGEAPSNLINVGAYSFTGDLFEILAQLKPSPRGEIELTDAVLELARQRKMHHVKVSQYWKPVGYPWHILEATQVMLQHNNNLIHKGSVHAGAMVEPEVSIDTGSVVHKGAKVTGLVTIGKNVTVEQGATIIGPTSIAHNSRIRNDAIIEASVIGQNSTIGQNCRVHHSIIGTNVQVYDNIATDYNSPEKTIHILVKGKQCNTKRNQLGVIVADGCSVSKNTTPGEIIQ